MLSTALLPLAALFGVVTARRRARLERERSTSPLPVIVVGNVTVGGTGKTPLVAAIVALASERGWRCGIVSRGYGGTHSGTARLVVDDDDPALVGDEPLMLRRLTAVPVAVCADRPAAVARLAATEAVDLVIADDGLQHYAMARSIEICVVDAESGLGNGRLLPAGPLREPAARLANVDIIAVRGPQPDAASPSGIQAWPEGVDRGTFTLQAESLMPLRGGPTGALGELAGQRVHAIAGIGRPERLFATLEAAGVEVVRHAFPDHHRYRAAELRFDDALPIVTTDKDAVKLDRIAPEGLDIRVLRMRAVLSRTLEAALHAQLDRLRPDPRQEPRS